MVSFLTLLRLDPVSRFVNSDFIFGLSYQWHCSIKHGCPATFYGPLACIACVDTLVRYRDMIASRSL